jgi:hypothetical protein
MRASLQGLIDMVFCNEQEALAVAEVRAPPSVTPRLPLVWFASAERAQTDLPCACHVSPAPPHLLPCPMQMAGMVPSPTHAVHDVAEMAQHCLLEHCGMVVVSMGSQGCMARSADGQIGSSPACSVPVVDTVGEAGLGARARSFPLCSEQLLPCSLEAVKAHLTNFDFYPPHPQAPGITSPLASCTATSGALTFRRAQRAEQRRGLRRCRQLARSWGVSAWGSYEAPSLQSCSSRSSSSSGARGRGSKRRSSRCRQQASCSQTESDPEEGLAVLLKCFLEPNFAV